MSTTDERRTTMQALFAVAASGGKFWGADVTYDKGFGLFDHVADFSNMWSEPLQASCVPDRETAMREGAYFVERVWLSGRKYGYRLCSFMNDSGGHNYHGETFKTADDFWAAMRTVVDLIERARRNRT